MGLEGLVTDDDRSGTGVLEFPTEQQFAAGVHAFEANEPRADVYFHARTLISDGWGDPPAMATGVKALLDVWHRAFYRFGNFDIGLLNDRINTHLEALDRFGNRSIETLATHHDEKVAELFDAFLDALRGRERRSPVAAAKALHLLAPTFFPLWDTQIALAYGSWWWCSEFGSMEYVPFSWKMKRFAEHIAAWDFVRARPQRGPSSS